MEQTLKTNWKKLSREERGKLLAKSTRIVKTPQGWRVTSQTNTSRQYVVKFIRDEPKCSCPDCELRHKKCKHIYAVEFYVKKQIDEEGKVTETKGVKISYSQDWKAYNNAQTNEKLVFMKLLKDLCGNIEQPLYKFGRPTLPFSDMLFGCVMKVYTGFSLRRFMSDMKIAKEMQLVDEVPCYSSLSNFMNREEIKSLLKEMITLSSLPLKEVETDFAIDSSGFSTSRFGRWFDYKYGRERTQRLWLKAHVMSGTKTNIIAGVEVTEGEVNDVVFGLKGETNREMHAHFGIRVEIENGTIGGKIFFVEPRKALQSHQEETFNPETGELISKKETSFGETKGRIGAKIEYATFYDKQQKKLFLKEFRIIEFLV